MRVHNTSYRDLFYLRHQGVQTTPDKEPNYLDNLGKKYYSDIEHALKFLN